MGIESLKSNVIKPMLKELNKNTIARSKDAAREGVVFYYPSAQAFKTTYTKYFPSDFPWHQDSFSKKAGSPYHAGLKVAKQLANEFRAIDKEDKIGKITADLTNTKNRELRGGGKIRRMGSIYGPGNSGGTVFILRKFADIQEVKKAVTEKLKELNKEGGATDKTWKKASKETQRGHTTLGTQRGSSEEISKGISGQSRAIAWEIATKHLTDHDLGAMFDAMVNTHSLTNDMIKGYNKAHHDQLMLLYFPPSERNVTFEYIREHIDEVIGLQDTFYAEVQFESSGKHGDREQKLTKWMKESLEDEKTIERIFEGMTNKEGSPSLEQRAAGALAVKLAKAMGDKKAYAKAKKDNIKSKKDKVKVPATSPSIVSPKITKGKKPKTPKRFALKSGRTSWARVRSYLNARLPGKLKELMVAPALVWRTGRFASSVKVTDIREMKSGNPEIGFQYMTDPYQVFDIVKGRRPWATVHRDPNRIITRGIRELLAEQQITKFKTTGRV